MKFSAALLAALASCSGHVSGAALKGRVTPTQQVINMLTDMHVKGKSEIDKEGLTFRKYAEWADDLSKQLGFEIQTNSDKIEQLSAEIAKLGSDVAQLGDQIGNLQAELDTTSAEQTATTDRGVAEKKECGETLTDLGESVDALERAKQVVSAQKYDRKQAEALLQEMSRSSLTGGVARVLAAVQAAQAPEVAAYESQSGGVLELLESLHDKFKGELGEAKTQCTNEVHNCDLQLLHLGNTAKSITQELDEKAGESGEKKAAKAGRTGELQDASADKASDVKLKADTEATLKVKTGGFQENQRVRKLEVEAIGKAVEILSSPEVQEGYEKHLVLAQGGVAAHQAAPLGVAASVRRHGVVAALVQVGSRRASSGTEEAVRVLRARAKATGSAFLAGVASDASEGPLDKVIGMIEDLLAKLEEEATSEAEHEAWCSKNLHDNKLAREKLTVNLQGLQSTSERQAADISASATAITQLSQEQAVLAKAMSDAVALRSSEKAENEAAIKDAKAGADAVKRAVVVLKEFYATQQSPAGAFVQAKTSTKQVPEMAAYTGMQSSNGGVVGMLEVIQSDFVRLDSDTAANEHAAAASHDEFIDESTQSKKEKHDSEFKTSLAKDQVEFEKSRTDKDIVSVTKQLKAANSVYNELKNSCIQVKVSFEERMRARQEEVDALKQAYTILDRKKTE